MNNIRNAAFVNLKGPGEMENSMLDDMIMYENQHSSTKYKKILQDLRSGEPAKMVHGITLLCTELSVIENPSESSFPIDAFIPEILKCMKKESNPDIMIHSTASLRHILDHFPSGADILVINGGVNLLCEKIQNLEYIDIAENSLRTLEKVSKNHGDILLKQGILKLLLNLIDFFIITLQKTILETIINVIKLIPDERLLVDYVIPVWPEILNFMKIEKSWSGIFFSMVSKLCDRIVKIFNEEFAKRVVYIDECIQPWIVQSTYEAFATHLNNGLSPEKISEVEDIIRILNKACYYSENLCIQILKLGVIDSLRILLKMIITRINTRGWNLNTILFETVLFLNSILALRNSPHPLIANIAPIVGIKIMENPHYEKKVEMFKKNNNYLKDFVFHIYPLLIEVFEKTPEMLNKYLVLIIIEKIMNFVENSILLECVNIQELATFLTSLLMTEEIMIVTISQLIISILTEKLPKIVILFKRMGLYERLRQLTLERGTEKLEIIPNIGQNSKGLYMFPKMDSGFFEFSKYESVAEKMENLNRKNSDIGQKELEHKPKFISNIKQTVEKKRVISKSKPVREKPINGGSRPLESQINLNKYKKANSTENENDLYTQRNAQLRNEILALCQSNFRKLENIMKLKENVDQNSKLEQSLIDIADSLLSNKNQNEFGFKIFEKIFQFLQNEKDLTNFELFSFRIVEGLVKFLTCVELDRFHSLAPQIIVRRIFAFISVFKRPSPINGNISMINYFGKQLKSLLTSLYKLTFAPQESSTEIETALNYDLKFLSQRIRFKVRFQEMKKLLTTSQTIQKSKPSSSPDKNPKITSQKTILLEQQEMMEFKETIFKELPILILSVEQYGTLEVVEDYLLNKLASKNDGTQPGLLQNIFKKIQRDGERMELINNNKEDDSDDENPIERDSRENFSSGQPNTKYKSPLPLDKIKKAQSENQSKSDQKMNKMYLHEKFSKKKVNFKHYLELEFFMDDALVSKATTIYALIQKYKQATDNLDSDTLIIDYSLKEKNIQPDKYSPSCVMKEHTEEDLEGLVNSENDVVHHLLKKTSSMDKDEFLSHKTDLKYILQMYVILNEIDTVFNRLSSSCSTFRKVLCEVPEFKKVWQDFNVNSIRLEPLVNKENFTNPKISFLFNKEFSDPISVVGGLQHSIYKTMCTNTNFLISFEARLSFFKYISSHVTRGLYYIFQTNKIKLKELESLRIGKLRRKKIKVPRVKLIENAIVNFESYGPKKSVLEFEFFEEEGSGLGPTLEYYSLIANEITNPSYRLWRKTDDGSLFPTPFEPFRLYYEGSKAYKNQEHKQEHKVESEKLQLIFRMIGSVVARALLDERMVDIPLNRVFWSLVLKRPVYAEDLLQLDKSLADTLAQLKELANQKEEIDKNTALSPQQQISMMKKLTFKGCNIEDLGLFFTFPGYDDIFLIENGDKIPVNLSNVHKYVSLVTQFFFNKTIKLQVTAFREGFQSIINLDLMDCFLSEEIELLHCGLRNEVWDFNDLRNNILPAHGYLHDSVSYVNLIKILTEFTPDEQRSFLKFMTGSPRLPFGGFKSYTPKITVVKKTPNLPTDKPDEVLPSVMTCQNYIKLPDYSSKEIMKKRLIYAMTEGQNNFTLS